MSDQETAGEPQTETEAASDSQPKTDPRLAEARDEAITERKKRQEAQRAAKEAASKAEKMEAELARIRRHIGGDEADDTDEAIKAAEERGRAAQQRAERALKKAAFKEAALDAGIKPDRVDAAFKLADLEGVEVDLETSDVSGAADAAQAVLETMPEFAMTNNDPKNPGTSKAAPGTKRKHALLDFDNYQPGQLQQMADEDPEAYANFTKGGLKNVPMKLGNRVVRVNISGQDNSVTSRIKKAQQRLARD